MANERNAHSDELPISADAAFVVHLMAAGADAIDAARGRIEHISSGRSTHFASTAELIAFMRNTLATV